MTDASNVLPVKWHTILTISGAFVGFLIGSGFATGQEAMQFYVAFGQHGVIGVAVSLVVLGYATHRLLSAGFTHQLSRNEDVFKHFCGRWLGLFLTWYTMVFIVAVYAVMIAGAGATLHQAYGVSPAVGAAMLAVLSLVTILLGLHVIIQVLGFVGPLLIALVILVATLSLYSNVASLPTGLKQAADLHLLAASDHWLMSALLYVGLTLPGLAGFLPAVGATMTNNDEVPRVSVLGPLVYMAALLVVVLALASSINEVADAEVPVLMLATNVLPVYGLVFGGVIILGIYTTITPLLWSVCRRFGAESSSRYRVIAIVLSLIGLVGGLMLPFGELVNLIYPTVGFAGLLFLACIMVTDCRQLFSNSIRT